MTRLREWLSSWFNGRTVTHYSQRDVIYIDSVGRVVAHRRTWSAKRLTIL